MQTINSIDGVDVLCNTLHKKAEGPRLYVLKVDAINLPRSLPQCDAN